MESLCKRFVGHVGRAHNVGCRDGKIGGGSCTLEGLLIARPESAGLNEIAVERLLVAEHLLDDVEEAIVEVLACRGAEIGDFLQTGVVVGCQTLFEAGEALERRQADSGAPADARP